MERRYAVYQIGDDTLLVEIEGYDASGNDLIPLLRVDLVAWACGSNTSFALDYVTLTERAQ